MKLEQGKVVLRPYQDQEPEPLILPGGEGVRIPPVDVASGLGGGDNENFYSGHAAESVEPEGDDIMRALEGRTAEEMPGLDTIIEMYVPASELPVPEPRVPKPATLKTRAASLFGRGKVAPVDVALERFKKAKAAGIR
jgi:hypothetical protein